VDAHASYLFLHTAKASKSTQTAGSAERCGIVRPASATDDQETQCSILDESFLCNIVKTCSEGLGVWGGGGESMLTGLLHGGSARGPSLKRRGQLEAAEKKRRKGKKKLARFGTLSIPFVSWGLGYVAFQSQQQ